MLNGLVHLPFFELSFISFVDIIGQLTVKEPGQTVQLCRLALLYTGGTNRLNTFGSSRVRVTDFQQKTCFESSNKYDVTFFLVLQYNTYFQQGNSSSVITHISDWDNPIWVCLFYTQTPVFNF